MEIIIHQAILHVLDTTLDAPVLSGGGMELTAEKTAYLQNHICLLYTSHKSRNAGKGKGRFRRRNVWRWRKSRTQDFFNYAGS